MFLHEIGGISWLTLWRCWLHSCGMFSLLVEYGVVHRGDCINCETRYFCFDPAFVWPSLVCLSGTAARLSHSSCLVKNELGNSHSSLLLYCILHYTGSSSVNWLTVSCILTVTLWDTGFKCKSSTQFMCLIINPFVTVTIMYYSNLQVNYMVTVFIRLVIAVV